jgi:hypothetical protein
MNNFSVESEDTRTITRILYEKATFGAVPVTFKLHGDDRLHPVQFTKHPELGSVQFSDGTTIVVSQPPAPVLKDSERDRDPDPNNLTAYAIPLGHTRLSDDLPETAVEDMTADLSELTTQTVTEEAAVPVDDGMATEYTDAETRRMARKFSPKPPSEEYKEAVANAFRDSDDKELA